MRTNQLLLYKNMEHGELLRDITFLMENYQNDYYNKEDIKCCSSFGVFWHNYMHSFIFAN